MAINASPPAAVLEGAFNFGLTPAPPGRFSPPIHPPTHSLTVDRAHHKKAEKVNQPPADSRGSEWGHHTHKKEGRYQIAPIYVNRDSAPHWGHVFLCMLRN